MIPHTVPKRPTNGAALAVVPRKGTIDSSWVTSATAARLSARSTFSMPPSCSAMAPSGPFFWAVTLESST